MKYLLSLSFLVFCENSYSMEKKQIKVGSFVRGIKGAPEEQESKRYMVVRFVVKGCTPSLQGQELVEQLKIVKGAMEACGHKIDDARRTNTSLLSNYWNNTLPDSGETYFVTTHGLPCYVHSSWVELEEK